MNEIPKAYNPSEIEDKWYEYWLKNRFFHSEVDTKKDSYTIVIPPPNVTGILTLGHVLNNTIQDIYIRYKRLKGFNTCWVPGTDHASIATESKVKNYLKDQGIEKFDIGRDEFLKHCKEWQEKYGGIIIQQLKKLGVSCDWERERFTMDDSYYKAVIDTFVKLYNEGKIFKGNRMVNWDPASRSAISDEEVIYKEQQSKLWYIKYPVIDSDEFIVVATTRPETMLGDTGIAVNPEDERFKKYIGKNVLLPIVEREIPVFADEYVEKDFGTGAVKVTPAHDVNDFAMGQRHNLEIINIFNDDASTNHNVPEELRGLDRFEVRKRVVTRLKELGLMQKEEDYVNKVGYSERGGVPIEPYLSEQWFMKMNELAKPAIEVVERGEIKFHPDHWKKTYSHWMNGIQDWCISRQLWWGHRIPVWYCLDCKNVIVQSEAPTSCSKCGSSSLMQDEDVLDTWASSWLWAYDVFKTEDEQKYYYPTDLLVTAPDIIFFWVARMIMAGLHFKKQIPFKDVYFTSVVRDTSGRKMSKTLGNSPDPLDVIKEYGADALRFSIIYLAPLGHDVLFSTEKCELGRNFANKIWNAGRYLLMNAQNIKLNKDLINKNIDFADRWIQSRFNRTIKEYEKLLDEFEINAASKVLYAFIWNDFCDWFIELSKSKLYSDEEEIRSSVLTRAFYLFEQILKMLHPFMPFISEELFFALENRTTGESISTSGFPLLDEKLIDTKAEGEMELIQDIIVAIRNIRGEMNIPPSKVLNAVIKTDALNSKNLGYIKKLAKLEDVITDADVEKPRASASAIGKNFALYIPLEGIIDLDAERKRIQKEIDRLQSALTGIDKKLSNENFLKNAAVEIVEKEKDKQKTFNEKLFSLSQNLQNLS